MPRSILNWIAVGWAAALLASLVSMMAVFMGSVSGDLRGLLAVQALLLPVALVAAGLYLRRAGRYARGQGTAALIWRHTPGWLVFTVASAASLTLIAELTMLLIAMLAEQPRPAVEHVPAISVLVNALLLAMAFADLKIEEHAQEPDPRS